MEREIALREATPEDIEEILAVQRASAEAAAWSAADYASLLAAEDTLCLLAVDPVGERVAGFVLGRTIADEMEILNLAVAPDYRRQGIGRHLLARALGQGARTCWLEVRAANQAALEFYRALGFVQANRRGRYYRDPEDDALVCVRRLPAAGPAP